MGEYRCESCMPLFLIEGHMTLKLLNFNLISNSFIRCTQQYTLNIFAVFKYIFLFFVQNLTNFGLEVVFLETHTKNTSN